MVLFVVHASFQHLPDGTVCSQTLRLPNHHIAQNKRAKLVGYQVTFANLPDVNSLPDHIIVKFRDPAWLGKQVHTACPPSGNDGSYPHVEGIPLPINGLNTIQFGMSGIEIDIAEKINRTLDIEVLCYDVTPVFDADGNKSAGGTDAPYVMTRPLPGLYGEHIKLDHILLYFSI